MDVSSSFNEPPVTKRKLKKIYSKIRKQMEFYFSDSNLVKDKFLSDLISKDPDGFVDIEIFKTFNKIKAFTNSTEVIASSVSRSSLFELSDDRTRLRRVTPLELSQDFDACTLYVEKLPTNADQKWIKDVFEHFGTVRYVNVPRYKISNKIKGFAFIEFANPDSVQKACEFYKAANEKECLTSEDENKNTKNAKKHKHEDVNDRKSKRSRIRSTSESSEKLTDISSLKSDPHHETSEKDNGHQEEHHHQKGKRKRKRQDSGDEIALKKSKQSATDDYNATTVKCDNEVTAAKCDNEVTAAKCDNEIIKESDIKNEDVSAHQEQQNMGHESLEKVDDEHDVVNMEESKTKRKRRNAKKHRSNAEKPVLRVMPKSEWKAFRNKYLELQRATMSLLKKQIMLETQEFKEQECNTKPADVSDHKKSLQFQPGVIIKVKLSDPVKNASNIKNEVKANAVVAYVDVPEQSSEMFIRCHTPEEAQVIVKEEKLSHLGKVELLKDTEETKYWDKIESDRKLKFCNPVPHKKRGREKLLAKAAKLEEMKNKHIYFDE